jgi:N-acylglucosamine-6-phosphate 2-epimerase
VDDGRMTDPVARRGDEGAEARVAAAGGPSEARNDRAYEAVSGAGPIIERAARSPIVASLAGGVIVSCQANPEDPLHGPRFMAAMARAAVIGGAVAIRANGPDDIAAIRKVVSVPIIGIWKVDVPGFDVRITPTIEQARAAAGAGASIIALDATDRPHPGVASIAELIDEVRAETGLPVMADVSSVAEGLAAELAGAELVATTLSGYVEGEPQTGSPDLALVERLAPLLHVPLIAEGRISTPDEAAQAIELGAFAVVVGHAVTRPEWITERFVWAVNHR